MAGIMKQIKRPHKKVPLSPSELCKHYASFVFCCMNVLVVVVFKTHLIKLYLFLLGDIQEQSDIVAGDRSDNQWLQYNSSHLPCTQQDWDHCVFVEKTHWGYYCWPRLLHFD